jgi:hypothetical protein
MPLYWSLRSGHCGLSARGRGTSQPLGYVPGTFAGESAPAIQKIRAVSGSRRSEENPPCLLTQPIGEAQRDLLQSFNQHIVVESAMELRLFRHGPLCAFVQGDCGRVSVHR